MVIVLVENVLITVMITNMITTSTTLVEYKFQLIAQYKI